MPTGPSAPRSRIFGLDLMRAVAIVLVVASHADDLLVPFWTADTGVADLDGVDLFFVLSGFLIGGILLRTLEATEIPWQKRLLDFWQRRWLRTLPNYFLFLAINIVLVHEGWMPGLLNVNALAYFVFLQNFIIPLELFYWESWSLAVEEWFYLLFPLAVFLFIGALRRHVKGVFLWVTLIMIAIPTLLRFPAMDAVATPAQLDLLVRKIVVLRLDTIGFGVLAAWAFHYFPAIWRSRRAELLLIGLFGYTTATLLRGPDSLMYMGTWYFTFSAISMALWLPALASWERVGRWGAPIAFISRISYALYLVHLPVRYLLDWFVVRTSKEAAMLQYVAYWAICIVLAMGVYLLFERRFMGMRKGLSRRILAT
ncbi:MAG: acyltransferase [Flavobacteriales bacterium]